MNTLLADAVLALVTVKVILSRIVLMLATRSTATVVTVLALLFVSLRSRIALFGSTVALLVAEPSALGALVLIVMRPVPLIGIAPPAHVTTPLACEQLKPLSPLAETNCAPAGS